MSQQSSAIFSSPLPLFTGTVKAILKPRGIKFLSAWVFLALTALIK